MLLCFLEMGTPVAQVCFYTTGISWFCFSHFTLNCFSLLADMLGTSRKKISPFLLDQQDFHAHTKGQ